MLTLGFQNCPDSDYHCIRRDSDSCTLDNHTGTLLVMVPSGARYMLTSLPLDSPRRPLLLLARPRRPPRPHQALQSRKR